jgi:hypothetical protein
MQSHISPFRRAVWLFLCFIGFIFSEQANAQTKISSNSPLCETQQLTLSTEQIVGAIYSWSGPNGFTSTSNPAIIQNANPTNSGNYFLTVDNGGSISTSSVTVVINPKPVPPTTQNVTICQGSPAFGLNASLSGLGNSLLWYGSNSSGGVGNSTTPIFNPNIIGITDVYVSQIVNASGCESERAKMTILTNPKPAPPSVQNPVYCQNDVSAPLIATSVSGNSPIWYGANSTGGIGYTVAPIPSTVVAGTYIFYVSQRMNITGCESERAALTVTVNPMPALPVVQNVTYCQEDTPIQLVASTNAGNTLVWYGTNSTGGVGNTNAPVPNTIVAGTITYYVSSKVNSTGCESARASLTVMVHPKPTPPVVTNITYCQGDVATSLSAMPINGFTLLWYGQNSVGGVGSTVTPIPNTSSAGTFTFYVSQRVNGTGCESNRTAVIVTVNPTPVAPTGQNYTYCQGAITVPLNATSTPGNTLIWYGANSTGGIGSTTAPTPSTATAGLFNYYVSNRNNATACESSRSLLRVTVVSNVPPNVLSGQRCGIGTVLLSASCSGASVNWYNSSTATTAIGSGNTFTTPVLSATTTYYAECIGNGCVSVRDVAYAIIAPIPVVTAASSMVCQGQNVVLTSTASGGTVFLYSWAGPSSFTSTQQNPSRANVTPSMSGIYTVTVSNNHTCFATATTSLTVNLRPVVTATSSTVCQGQNAFITSTAAGGTGFLYSWVGPNSFISTQQNIVRANATSSMSGVYTVTVLNSMNCSATATASLTVNLNPVVVASGSTVGVGDNATLTASGGNIYNWAGPNNFTSTSQNPIINNINPSQAGVYTVTVTNASGCTASATASITVNVPPLPPALVSFVYCQDDIAIPLIANQLPNHTVLWYGTNATGGTGSTTAPIPSTTTAGTVVYYASKIDNATGLESERASTTVIVNPKPVPPAVTNVTYCQGQSAIPLISTSIQGSSLYWYGTNSVFGVGSTTAPTPNTNTAGTTTFYVSRRNDATLCESDRIGITVVVNPTPTAPVASNYTLCESSNPITLTATVDAVNSLIWYSNGIATSTAPVHSPNVAGTFNYLVSQINPNNCESSLTVITVTVNPKPARLNQNSSINACVGDASITLSANPSANHTLLWYTSRTGVGSSTAPTHTPNTEGIFSYYVTQINQFGCESEKDSILVRVNSVPNLPTVSNLTYCQNAIATSLTATANAGNTLIWYGTNSAGGVGSTIAPTPSTSTAGTMIYYVSQKNAFCESDRIGISVVVNPTPTAPVASNYTVCEGSTPIMLTATANAGNSLIWYSNGIATSTAPVHSPNVAGTFNYLVSQINPNNCESSLTVITITVNPKPARLNQNSSINACVGGASITLSANPSANHTLLWYTSRTGVGSSTAPTHTPNTQGIFSYYVTQINQFGCESEKDSILVRVNSVPNLPTVSNLTYCQNAIATSLTATANAGNTLIWYGTNSAGGVGSNIAPTPNTSTAGTMIYYVSQKNTFCESSRAAISVLIKPTPSVTASSNSPLTVGQTLNLSANAIAGATYSWTGANGFSSTLQNPSVSNVTTSQSGNYRVTVNLNGCTTTATTTVVINQPTPVNHLIYQDALGTGWGYSAVNTSLNFINLSPVQQGFKSISVKYNASNTYLRLNRSTAISLTGYTHLKFWVHGGNNGGQKIRIKINEITTTYAFTATAKKWTLISIPLSTFGSVTSLSSITFQNNHSGSQSVFYLDNIYLATNANARIANIEEETPTFSEFIEPNQPIANTDFQVYPNPIYEGERALQIKLEGFEDNGQNHIEITDNQGFTIKSLSRSKEETEQVIDLPNLKSGIYLIKITNGKTTKTKRLVVQ